MVSAVGLVDVCPVDLDPSTRAFLVVVRGGVVRLASVVQRGFGERRVRGLAERTQPAEIFCVRARRTGARLPPARETCATATLAACARGEAALSASASADADSAAQATSETASASGVRRRVTHWLSALCGLHVRLRGESGRV
ncbi:MAG TPA: hypothetical protein VK707_06190 [Solirubrobacteraceae bacterium]|nr:hypothetical protein [Solirubrobacteraceae bacterium]